MNSNLYRDTVRKAIEPKFKGKNQLKSKVKPRYPASAEREFQRVTAAYMNLMYNTLKNHLPVIMNTYQRECRKDARYDDVQDAAQKMRDEMQKAAEELEQKIAAFGLKELVQKIGDMASNTSIREWKRVVHETLGINLLDDYYKGELYAKLLQEWVAANVNQIKSIPNQQLSNMQVIIMDGFLEGRPVREIQKKIQNEYKVSKAKARMLARDQLSTLNANITKRQQTDAGITQYRWSDSGDERVRDCHRELNGKTFSWDDPPQMWYMTKSKGKVMSPRHCHPGEDYCCRCVAIPVFDFETLDVPIKADS